MNILVAGKCRPLWLLILSIVLSMSAGAENQNDYDRIASSSFWEKLYPAGGWSLYCGYKFAVSGKTAGKRSSHTSMNFVTD